MQKIRTLIITFLLEMVCFGVVVNPAYAQSVPDLDLLVFPSAAYLQVIPGKSITHHVLLQYSGTHPIQVTPRVRDFVADGTTGVPVIKDSISFTSISLESPTNPGQKLGEPFILQPNTKLDLVLTIKPDVGLVEKEYHLVLLVTAEPLPGTLSSSVGAAASGVIGSNMIISVSKDGTNTGNIKVTDFPMPRFIDSFSHLNLKVLAENSGQTATVPRGTITLHDWHGTELTNWFVYPDIILAQSTRLLRATKDDPTQLKENTTAKVVPMEYDAPFLLGPYTITTQLVGADGNTEQHTAIVYALPFSILVALFIGASSYIFYRILRNRLNQKQW